MMMNRSASKVTFLLAFILCFGLFAYAAAADQSGLRIPEQVNGDRAWEHVCYLSEMIGARPTESEQEAMAQAYIIEQFEALGYDVEIQEFSFKPRWSSVPFNSANIIATKPGKIDQTVIVGAHYDSVFLDDCEGENVHTGAGDNASGVGVMLEVAEVLAGYKTHGTIKFVAFGAEEWGLWGSFHYADQMTAGRCRQYCCDDQP